MHCVVSSFTPVHVWAAHREIVGSMDLPIKGACFIFLLLDNGRLDKGHFWGTRYIFRLLVDYVFFEESYNSKIYIFATKFDSSMCMIGR